jgi:hypothetical protein
VLPGDDFKEIWTQQLVDQESSAAADFVCEVCTSRQDRTGYFLVVGDHFAFTLSREGEGGLGADRMKSFFDGEGDELDDTEKEQLMQYVCVIGRTSDWSVQYSLDSSAVGSCILPGTSQSATGALLSSLQWKVVDGSIPEAIAALLSGSSPTDA